MDENYNFSLKYPVFYLISKNDTFYLLKFICWIIGLYINLLCFIVLELNDLEDGGRDLDSRKLRSDSYKQVIDISSFIFSGISFALLLIWFIFRYPMGYKIKEYEFMDRNQDGAGLAPDLSRFLTKIYIGVVMTFGGDTSAQNFMIHFIAALLGVFVSPVFHTLHLLLLINISETARYVVRASIAHLDQLLATLILAVFLIYAFSMLNADYFSGSFSDDVGEIDIC